MTFANHPIHHPTGRVQWSFSAWPCQEASACRPLFRWAAECHLASGFRRRFEGAAQGALPPSVSEAFAAAKRGDTRLRSFVETCPA